MPFFIKSFKVNSCFFIQNYHDFTFPLWKEHHEQVESSIYKMEYYDSALICWNKNDHI